MFIPPVIFALVARCHSYRRPLSRILAIDLAGSQLAYDSLIKVSRNASHTMRRYFFDLVDPTRSEYDYRGREMASAEKARELAELIAIDESFRGNRIGWLVKVSDAAGASYYSVPVDFLPELAAA
jgi:hypothetical protein